MLSSAVGIVLVLLAGVNAGWTPWLDRDDPSATGDWETVKDFKPKPCNGLATMIQVKLRGDNAVIVSASERLSVGPDYGLVCKNAEQYDGYCLNYAVNYLVPRLSKIFNRDHPSATGDWELKSLEKGKDWKSGAFVYWYANDSNYGLVHHRLELGPRLGLICKNNEQSGDSCSDYQVRFFCP